MKCPTCGGALVRWHAWGLCPPCIKAETQAPRANAEPGRRCGRPQCLSWNPCPHVQPPYALGQTEAVRKQRPS